MLLAPCERHVVRSDRRGALAIKIEKAFWISVSSDQANINIKSHSMLGKMTVNVVIHRKQKQHYLHHAVCGTDHPVRIICALTEQNLNRPQLISRPTIIHSPGTILHVLVPCLFSPTSSSGHVSSVSETTGQQAR